MTPIKKGGDNSLKCNKTLVLNQPNQQASYTSSFHTSSYREHLLTRVPSQIKNKQEHSKVSNLEYFKLQNDPDFNISNDINILGHITPQIHITNRGK